jgi:hypothetical protein
MHNTEAIEAVRARYRPNRITTLFVGESAPNSGAFFYCGNTAMLRNMQRAVEAAIDGEGDFLERFKSYSWYLDDLVLTPVNQLRIHSERRAKCFACKGQSCDSNRRIPPARDRLPPAQHRQGCEGCGSCGW